MRRHLDLFSGIGGFALAAHWAGYETMQFVEIDPFCQRVLKKHWPEVPIHDDIKSFDATGLAGNVELLTGGFPCQPFSVAGKQAGNDDDRALWPEMRRVIAECRPRWVLAENVPGFIDMALDELLDDLEALDYEAGSLIIPAVSVGAPHLRQRLWIVAHAGRGDGVGWPGESRGNDADRTDAGRTEGAGWAGERGTDVPDAQDERLQATVRQSGRAGDLRARSTGIREDAADPDPRGREEQRRTIKGRSMVQPQRRGWWEVEPGMGRLVDGLPRGMAGHRISQLKALGNAIVPQVAYEIIRRLEEAEDHGQAAI